MDMEFLKSLFEHCKTAITQHKPVVDVTAVGITLSTVVDAMPAIASVLSALWALIRLYETSTIQRLIHGKKAP